MAPRRPDKKSKKRAAALSRAAAGGSSPASDPSPSASASSSSSSPQITPLVLVRAAEAQLQEGNAEAAAALAQNALDQAQAQALTATGSDDDATLAALNFLGQVHLELGDLDAARSYYLRAAALDPEGARDEAVGGGAEKFLCLAQLSEEGGRDSVAWFEKGAVALRARIQSLEFNKTTKPNTTLSKLQRQRNHEDEAEAETEELKRKLAMALCSVAEVYMTDLSWEADAEQRCEALVTEATLVAPASAEAWQTLADVRISQARPEDARAALARSLDVWKGLEPDHRDVPAFPSRVALARLLMEVGMEREALEVLERLVAEDDGSVQTWYLGGWGLFVLGEKLREREKVKEKSGEGKQQQSKAEDDEDDDWNTSWISSRVWLNQCLHLYKLQEYEDEPLGEHAKELLAAIVKELGEAPADGEGDDDDDEGEDGWEDAGDSDEEMQE